MSFNLLEEDWIPCLMPDGHLEEMGIKDVLVRAHEVHGISDASPLVNTALHRLMLAILHRNFGPKDLTVWKDLWRGGRWDADTLLDYFDEWRARFDLDRTRAAICAQVSPVARLAAPCLTLRELQDGFVA